MPTIVLISPGQDISAEVAGVSGAVIFELLPGQHKTTAPIELRTDQHLVGAGDVDDQSTTPGSVIFFSPAKGTPKDDFVVVRPTWDARFWSVRNLNINGYASPPADKPRVGVQVRGAKYGLIEGVSLTGFDPVDYASDQLNHATASSKVDAGWLRCCIEFTSVVVNQGKTDELPQRQAAQAGARDGGIELMEKFDIPGTLVAPYYNRVVGCRLRMANALVHFGSHSRANSVQGTHFSGGSNASILFDGRTGGAADNRVIDCMIESDSTFAAVEMRAASHNQILACRFERGNGTPVPGSWWHLSMDEDCRNNAVEACPSTDHLVETGTLYVDRPAGLATHEASCSFPAGSLSYDPNLKLRGQGLGFEETKTVSKAATLSFALPHDWDRSTPLDLELVLQGSGGPPGEVAFQGVLRTWAGGAALTSDLMGGTASMPVDPADRAVLTLEGGTWPAAASHAEVALHRIDTPGDHPATVWLQLVCLRYAATRSRPDPAVVI